MTATEVETTPDFRSLSLAIVAPLWQELDRFKQKLWLKANADDAGLSPFAREVWRNGFDRLAGLGPFRNSDHDLSTGPDSRAVAFLAFTVRRHAHYVGVVETHSPTAIWHPDPASLAKRLRSEFASLQEMILDAVELAEGDTSAELPFCPFCELPTSYEEQCRHLLASNSLGFGWEVNRIENDVDLILSTLEEWQPEGMDRESYFEALVEHRLDGFVWPGNSKALLVSGIGELQGSIGHGGATGSFLDCHPKVSGEAWFFDAGSDGANDSGTCYFVLDPELFLESLAQEAQAVVQNIADLTCSMLGAMTDEEFADEDRDE